MNLLISYPNAGRTWLSANLCQLDVEMGMAHYGAMDGIDIEIYMNKNPSKLIEDKVIFLSRGLKDHCVSNYFQARFRFCNYQDDIKSYIRSEKFGVENFIKYNIFWKRFSRCKEKMDLTYEMMQWDTLGTIKNVLAFLKPGVDFDENVIRNTIEYNSFDNMHVREISKQDGSRTDWRAKTDVNNLNSFKVRRGVIGGYVDYLDKDDILYIDQLVDKYDYNKIMGV